MLPLSAPIRGKDGKMMDSICVPKGTSVGVGIFSSNRSKAIWGEDAYEWKPERWLSPLPKEVVDAHIPGVYSHLYVLTIARSGTEEHAVDFSVLFRMTFSAGMRSCM